MKNEESACAIGSLPCDSSFFIFHFTISFFLLFVFGHSPAFAENRDSTRRYGFQVNVGMGKYINIDQYTKKFVKAGASYTFGAEINHSALPCDSNAFDSDYNYPNLSFGLR